MAKKKKVLTKKQKDARRERRKKRKVERIAERSKESRLCAYCRKKQGRKYLYPFIDPEEDVVLDIWLGGLACRDCLPVQEAKLRERGLLQDADKGKPVDWKAMKKLEKEDKARRRARKGKPRKPRKPAGPSLTGTVRDIVKKKGPITIEEIEKVLRRKKAFKKIPTKKIQRALYRLRKKREEIAKNQKGEWRYVGNAND